MKRRIYLLRSARAKGEDATLADYHRPLTRRGEAAAIRMGKLMQKNGYLPDLAICATPTRARQTLAYIWPALPGKPQLVHDYKIHIMRGEALLAHLRNTDSSFGCILMVGKEPGISELARLLQRQPAGALPALPAGGLAPCTLAVFECDIASWSELGPQCASLISVES